MSDSDGPKKKSLVADDVQPVQVDTPTLVESADGDVPRCGKDGIAHWRGRRLVTAGFFGTGKISGYKFDFAVFLQRHKHIFTVAGIDSRTLTTNLYDLDEVMRVYDQELKDKPRCDNDGIARWGGKRLVAERYFASARDKRYNFSLPHLIKLFPSIKPFPIRGVSSQGKPNIVLYDLDEIQKIYDESIKGKPVIDHKTGIASFNGKSLVQAAFFNSDRFDGVPFAMQYFLERHPSVKPVSNEGVLGITYGITLYDLEQCRQLRKEEVGDERCSVGLRRW